MTDADTHGVHFFLWTFQWLRWQTEPQYQTILQTEQRWGLTQCLLQPAQLSSSPCISRQGVPRLQNPVRVENLCSLYFLKYNRQNPLFSMDFSGCILQIMANVPLSQKTSGSI
jgi:hypothetical protein